MKQVDVDLKISELNNRDEALTTLAGYVLNNLGLLTFMIHPLLEKTESFSKRREFHDPNYRVIFKPSFPGGEKMMSS